MFESSEFSAETRRSIKSNPHVNHAAPWFTDAARVAANDLGAILRGIRWNRGRKRSANVAKTWPLLHSVISRAVAPIGRAFRWFDSCRNGEMCPQVMPVVAGRISIDGVASKLSLRLSEIYLKDPTNFYCFFILIPILIPIISSSNLWGFGEISKIPS